MAAAEEGVAAWGAARAVAAARAAVGVAAGMAEAEGGTARADVAAVMAGEVSGDTLYLAGPMSR